MSSLQDLNEYLAVQTACKAKFKRVGPGLQDQVQRVDWPGVLSHRRSCIPDSYTRRRPSPRWGTLATLDCFAEKIRGLLNKKWKNRFVTRNQCLLSGKSTVSGCRDLCGSLSVRQMPVALHMCAFDHDFLGGYSVLLLSVRVCACGESWKKTNSNSLESDKRGRVRQQALVWETVVFRDIKHLSLIKHLTIWCM